MDSWGVFGVIVAIVSFGVLVGTPLLKLNSSITKLNSMLTYLEKQFFDEKKSNGEEHIALWNECEKQGDVLNDHETRITVLEHDQKGVI